MKTMFGRQFLLTAACILCSILILGASFRVFIQKYVQSESQKSLYQSAEAVAELASAYESIGDLENNWEFHINLSFAAEAAGTDTVICDETGVVILCSCSEFRCAHLGLQVPQTFVDQVIQEGKTADAGILQGLYDDSRSVVSIPIISQADGGASGIVIASTGQTQVVGVIRQMTDIFLMTGAVVLLLAVIACSALMRRTSQPLKDLAGAARRFGHGNLDARVELDEHNPAEIEELAVAFNNMADSLEKSEQQRKEFIANVSHELKTPMTTIAGFMDGMLDGTIPPEQHRHYMQIVSDEVRRLSRMVRGCWISPACRIRRSRRRKRPSLTSAEAAGQVLVSFEQKITQKQLDVQVDMPDEATYTLADADSITQVIYNLMDNAVKFCQQGGTLGLKIQPEDKKIFVSVSNTGLTIPENELSRIFDRFHKTDKSRSIDRDGVGLGLYIVKTIICSHGEDISVTSRDGLTVFTFSLPVVVS
ncbi:MAG: HAMP domain-containing sensor histidine kinase [Oscillospiraceae bacterium]